MKKFWTVYRKMDQEPLRVMKDTREEAIAVATQMYNREAGEYFIFEYIGTIGIKPPEPEFRGPTE